MFPFSSFSGLTFSNVFSVYVKKKSDTTTPRLISNSDVKFYEAKISL